MAWISRLLAAAAIGLVPGVVLCATIHVDDDNTSGPWDGTPMNPYVSIQDAIDVAAPGDVIDVAGGTYGGQIRFEDKTDIELRGAGAEQTMIDGQFIGSVVLVFGSSVSIHGFTIANGDAPVGYAVWVRESRVDIHDNTIINNRGGIYAYACPPLNCPEPIAPSHLVIERNHIRKTHTQYAIFIWRSTGLIASNLVTGNTGSGAITLGGSPVDVLGNTIVDNIASIAVSTSPFGLPHRIANNIVVNNEWGIHVTGGETSETFLVDISHNDLWDNINANYWESWGGVGLPSYDGPFTPPPTAGEINVDPQFVAGGGYRLSPSSPCIDTGSPPQDFTGVACLDLDGGPRLRDADGDGVAAHDMGAVEYEDPTLLPEEVANVGWESTNPDRLTWDAEPSSDAYEVYRGELTALGYQDWGSCQGTTSATTFDDAELPPPGAGFFYVVTGQAGIATGTMGFATCAERSNYNGCP